MNANCLFKNRKGCLDIVAVCGQHPNVLAVVPEVQLDAYDRGVIVYCDGAEASANHTEHPLAFPLLDERYWHAL